MKLPFLIFNRQFAIFRQRGKTAAPQSAPGGNWRLAIGNRKSRSGIALIITLIMLSVTLVMALAFLAVSHRERDAVSTTTDTTTARLAADSALAAAQAQIAANILASTNVAAYSYGLLVSTNYINPIGLDPASGSPTNVNYDYTQAGNLLTLDQRNQNIANLLFLPRAPVFIYNTKTGSNDFRYYLDLNQNGRDEGNGLLPVISSDPANPYYNLNGNTMPAVIAGNTLSNSMTGDPEWIGVLEHPDQPHGPNNHFIARYAFAAVPVGNTLDLNAIHNQVLNPTLGVSDGFFRNEGVGTWELNLAAFLTDLNTNQWDPPTVVNPAISSYQYLEPYGAVNRGVSFEDALSLLAYRYGYNYNSLAIPTASFYDGLVNAGIDGYGIGPLMTSTFLPQPAAPVNTHWAGSDNTNRFFSLPSDLFGANMNLGNFPAHLSAADSGNSSYDRYTFYRMLDQLGTDTEPESGKLNLNYSNAVVNYSNGVVTGVTIIPGAETNLVPWTATNFFNAAADSMLKLYTTNWYAADPTNFLLTFYGSIPPNTPYIGPNGYGLTNFPYIGMTNQVPAFGISDIPVYVTNSYLGRYVFAYTPAVNRVLQLAANMYDASTNSFYPTVYRPLFEHDPSGNVFITGYTGLINGQNTVSGPGDLQLSLPLDVSALSTLGRPTYGTDRGLPIESNNVSVNVYGVPWIIGAKKGLPGLNQFSLVSAAQFTRKLQVVRSKVGLGANIWTNQMIVMSATNNLGISFWNSYSNNYQPPGPINLSIVVHSSVQSVVTNSDPFAAGYPHFLPLATANFQTATLTSWPGSKWAAYGGGLPAPDSFYSWQWTNTLVPQSVYNFTTHVFDPTALATYFWDTNRTILDQLPQFGLLTTNWLQAYIVDGTHVIDYVQLRGPISNANLNSGLNDPGPGGPANNFLWVTNAFGTGSPTSWGIVDQMDISSQPANPPAFARWNQHAYSIPGLSNPQTAARVFFASVLSPNSVYQYNMDNGQLAFYTNYELVVQAPYTASRLVYAPYLYQVNDPLVHYTVNDLDGGCFGDLGKW